MLPTVLMPPEKAPMRVHRRRSFVTAIIASTVIAAVGIVILVLRG